MSGMVAVVDSGSRSGRPGNRSSLAASTASSAITRYVVYLPPAIVTRPGSGLRTVCSREISDSERPSVSTSGRSPA